MSTSSLDAAAFDYEDGTNGKRAGLVMTWTAEGAAIAEQKAITRKIELRAEKNGAIL